ncbi:MAG TPA: hypothetical protein VMB84_11995 [Stellaceae bacterium]|nr:hypothetical protein [Stellaceae bacterium]
MSELTSGPATSEAPGELARREVGLARRLARLFRLEDRAALSAAAAARVVARRERLIGELAALEGRRRRAAPSPPGELDSTMGALAAEVGRAEQRCRARLAELDAELARRHGGAASGLRDGGGRLLGRG